MSNIKASSPISNEVTTSLAVSAFLYTLTEASSATYAYLFILAGLALTCCISTPVFVSSSGVLPELPAFPAGLFANNIISSS